MTKSARSAPLLTVAMISVWLGLATVPFWIEKVGLYQYLGVEILIFAIYALAYNIVLGHAGLPSFGHGAFFGIGAYAFGLAQHNVWPTFGFASWSPRWLQQSPDSSLRCLFRTGAASTTR
jgi:ABC-type branched-subunit amino acid transport system permease subunit